MSNGLARRVRFPSIMVFGKCISLLLWINGQCDKWTLWQYWLWSFKLGNIKLGIRLPKCQHIRSKFYIPLRLVYFLPHFCAVYTNFMIFLYLPYCFSIIDIKVPFEPVHFMAKINLIWYLLYWNSTTNTVIMDTKKKSCNSKAKSRKWQLICYWQTLFLPSKSLWKNCNTQIIRSFSIFLQFWKLLQQLNENFKAKDRKWQLICYRLTFSLSYQNSKATQC